MAVVIYEVKIPSRPFPQGMAEMMKRRKGGGIVGEPSRLVFRWQHRYACGRAAPFARYMEGYTQFVHGRSRRTIDPRIHAMPGRRGARGYILRISCCGIPGTAHHGA